jgi:polysaccharide export outer membrane protein
MRCFTTCLVQALTIGLSTLSATAAHAPQPQQPVAGERCPAAYVIGPEDLLDIAVWGNEALTRSVPVRPDGKISLPLLNDVHAAGLTPMELRDKLTEAFKEYMPSPSIAVLVREVHSFKVTVIGQVKTAGRYEIKDRATVLDVLALAGGLTDYAARGRVVVLRSDGPTPRQIPFPYDRLTSKKDTGGSAQANFCVHPGDVIVVP